MQQISIISVGKLNKNLQEIAREYVKMTKWQISSTEITYNKKLPAEQIKQFEAKEISKYLTPKSYKIVLDVAGKHLTSHEFSNILASGRNIDFIIGGAFGLDQAILDNSDLRLSMSKMTFPHQLAKVMLLEQIYRAQTILDNHPYHK